ncbi:WYL domain-containing protein [Saprospiraceae bacterium]|nr:WYL domain-containing protein [Saprospiraceae bacterium]
MPVNRNALVRYRTIDKALQNRYRKWTLDDLIEEVGDALYEYEGVDTVSKRTIQGDIQMMRSDKLGYNAPIVVMERKYYTYEDPNYSITNIPLTDQDLGMLTEAVQFLKQFQGFSHFQELDGMVQKLEDHIYSAKADSRPVIDFEKNENLRGLKYLDPLYRAILAKKMVCITYQSFKARKAGTINLHPFLLKEFRNRWFIIGAQKKREGVLNLALDRIERVEITDLPAMENTLFDPETYFDQAIGVTVSPTLPIENVVFFVNHVHAPYIKTKPLHKSQVIVSQNAFGVLFSIQVQLNFELEKMLLGFGDALRVIEPAKLKRTIMNRLGGAIDLYETELNESRLTALAPKLSQKGFVHFGAVFVRRDIGRIKAKLDREISLDKIGDISLLDSFDVVRLALNNAGVLSIIKHLGGKSYVQDARYVLRSRKYDLDESWRQDVVEEIPRKLFGIEDQAWIESSQLETKGASVWVSIILDAIEEDGYVFQFFSGSHNKKLAQSDLETVVNNSREATLEMAKGGVMLWDPCLIHREKAGNKQKSKARIDLLIYSVF